jgi:hypothetical protein
MILKLLNQFSYITIKLFYKTRVPVKKQDSLWVSFQIKENFIYF